jgi:hypothetical protein
MCETGMLCAAGSVTRHSMSSLSMNRLSKMSAYSCVSGENDRRTKRSGGFSVLTQPHSCTRMLSFCCAIKISDLAGKYSFFVAAAVSILFPSACISWPKKFSEGGHSGGCIPSTDSLSAPFGSAASACSILDNASALPWLAPVLCRTLKLKLARTSSHLAIMPVGASWV